MKISIRKEMSLFLNFSVVDMIAFFAETAYLEDLSVKNVFVC